MIRKKYFWFPIPWIFQRKYTKNYLGGCYTSFWLFFIKPRPLCLVRHPKSKYFQIVWMHHKCLRLKNYYSNKRNKPPVGGLLMRHLWSDGQQAYIWVTDRWRRSRGGGGGSNIRKNTLHLAIAPNWPKYLALGVLIHGIPHKQKHLALPSFAFVLVKEPATELGGDACRRRKIICTYQKRAEVAELDSWPWN